MVTALNLADGGLRMFGKTRRAQMHLWDQWISVDEKVSVAIHNKVQDYPVFKKGEDRIN